MARSASIRPPAPSALARLLETESELESVLRDAGERAEALIRAAESQAQAVVAALEKELSEAATQAEGRRSADCAARLGALSRENQLALDRLRAIGPDRVSELAHWVADQVLHGPVPESRE